MERAPWPVGFLFGISLAVVMLLAGPLLLFNPALTTALQVRHDVAAALGTTQDEVQRVTSAYLADIYLDGPFDASLDGEEPFLDAEERSHMSDVSRLVRLLAAILGAAVIGAVLTGYRLRREPRRQGEIMMISAAALGATALAMAAFFAVAFDTAFLLFHQLLFPPGTYLFETGSNLITLFPEPFWFDAALAAGASVILTALAVAVIGFLRWRGAVRPPDPA